MNRWTMALALVVCVMGVGIAKADITTFDAGFEGWSVNGNGYISPTSGNPDYALESGLFDAFGAVIFNNTNPAFLGDVTDEGSMFLTVDVSVNDMCYVDLSGHIVNVTRDFFVEFIDVISWEPFEAVSVCAEIGTLDPDEPGWHTYSTDTIDPTAADLPAGWLCHLGSADDWQLPEGRTFASVLESVDELRFSTYRPGYAYCDIFYDITVDNVGIKAVPEPATLSLLGLGAFALIRRRRQS